MFSLKNSAPRASSQNDIVYSPLLNDSTFTWERPLRKRVMMYLALEAMILFACFSAYVVFVPRQLGCTSELSSNEYLSLSNYNKTEFFTENNDIMRETAEAERFWIDILQTDGVVSVPTQWALDQGYSSSLEVPDRPGYGIYQVDMYHSLHCLDHIRVRLVSHVPLAKWPRDDKHSLHCINYLRQQVMCHADITLGGTHDVLHYSKNKGHQCRDYEAVVRWTKEHEWKGHAQLIEQLYGLEAGAASATSWIGRAHPDHM